MWWCGWTDIPEAHGKGGNGDCPLLLPSVNMKIIYWSKLGFTAAFEMRRSINFLACLFPFSTRATQHIGLHHVPVVYHGEYAKTTDNWPSKPRGWVWYNTTSLGAVGHSEQHRSGRRWGERFILLPHLLNKRDLWASYREHGREGKKLQEYMWLMIWNIRWHQGCQSLCSDNI